MRPGLTHNPCRSRERIHGGSEAQRKPASDLRRLLGRSGVRSPLPLPERRRAEISPRPSGSAPAPPGGEKREGRSASGAAVACAVCCVHGRGGVVTSACA